MKIGDTARFRKTFAQKDFDLFAELSGDDNPIHVDPEFSAQTKFGNTVAHGMLLYSTIGRGLGSLLPGSGMIQASQRLKFPNPTYVGQEIEIEFEIINFPSSEMIELNTKVVQPSGELGCIGEARVWFSGERSSFKGTRYDPPIYESPKLEHRGLRIGQVAEENRWFSLQDLKHFCASIDEHNPIHTDGEGARALGFRDVLLPGGLLGGLISDLLGTQLPGRGTNWLKQEFHFLAPAHPEEEITARVEIIRLRPQKELVNLRTTLTGKKGEILVDGEALVLVSDLAV